MCISENVSGLVVDRLAHTVSNMGTRGCQLLFGCCHRWSITISRDMLTSHVISRSSQEVAASQLCKDDSQ